MIEDKDSLPIKESEFNAAIATLRRLDEIKKFIDNATINDEADELYCYLKAFWKELDPIISKSEQQEQIHNFEECRKFYESYKKREMTKSFFISLLDAWELDLRRIEQAHKLNMPMGRDKRWVV